MLVLYGDVLAALNARGVPYVVVGGIAVVLHGHARLTVDLDLVVDLAADPAGKAIEILTSLGFRPRLPVKAEDFADPRTRTEWVERRNLTVFSMHDPSSPLREVDLFATHPIPFDDLVAASTVVPIDGIDVRVASVDHLIALKQTAGRPQDLTDIEALRRLGGRA